MANKKITELDAITTLASTDVVPVVDVSADTTNKITAANLFRTLPDGTAASPSLSFASDAANGVFLAGTDTVGISTGGTQRVTVDGSGNVTISGDLTVSGATTTVESTTVTIDDKNIELGSVATPTDTTADGGGITLKGATDKEIKWVNSTGYWTFNTGIDVGGNIDLADNNKIQLGTGDDLKLFHGGTNSEINNETGNLLIANKANDADVVIQSDNGSGGITTYVRCDGSNGEVRLYHYGTEKLNTKSDGVDITGELQVSSGTTDVVADFASSDANAWIQIRDNSTTDTAVMVGAVGDDLRFRAGSNEAARITSAGRLGIGTSAPASLLNISASSGGDTSGLRITRTDSGGGDWRIWSSATANGEGAGKLIFGNSGNRVVIDGSGNLGVGTTSPQSKLDLGSDTGVKLTLLQSNYSLGVESNELRIASNQSTTFYTGGHSGTERVRLDSSGRFLVGTSSSIESNSVIQAVSASNTTVIIGNTNTSASGEAVLNLAPSNSLTGAQIKCLAEEDFSTVANRSASLEFRTRKDGTFNEAMLIDSSGRVGIGASNAGSYNSDANDLVVASTGNMGLTLASTNSGNSNIHFADGTSGNASYRGIIAYLHSTDTMNFWTGGASRMNLDSSGRLLLGTTTEGQGNADNLTIADSGNCGITIRSGTSSAGNIYFSDATSGGGEYDGWIAYNQQNRFMQFGIGQVERFRITSTGAFAIEGASNYGTSGQVLTSNGNDAPTWQDAGAAVVGGASAISMNDSVKINFGAGDDLQIFHDGTDSFVTNDQGDLILRTVSPGDDVILRAHDDVIIQSGGSDNAIICNNDGDVELYYNTSKKLETKSDGVDVIGELQCDTLDVDGAADIAGQLDVNRVVIHDNGSSGPLLSVRADDNSPWAFAVGNDTYSTADTGLKVYQNNNGDVYTQARGNSAYVNWYLTSSNGTTSPTMIHFDTSRAVHLNYQGNTKLSTKSSGVDVVGQVECDTLGVGSSKQNASVASFKGDTNNQVNICDSTNSSWGLLLTQSQGIVTTDSYHYSSNSSVNKPCAIVNVNNDALHFATNNAARFRVNHDGHVLPTSNNSYDLGSSSLRWRNVYTNDLNLSNEGSTNDVDGTWGNYTIQEGEDDLFLINRRNGKKYKFNLTEVN